MKSEKPVIWMFAIGALLLVPLFIPVFLGVHGIAVTCSLYHNASLEEWWPQNSWKFPNITLEEFRQFPFPNGLTQLDVVFVNASPEDVEVGDIMVFQIFSDPPIIAHRVIRIWTANWTRNWADIIAGVPYPHSENKSRRHFSTVGDNWFQQPFEPEIRENQVIGKMVPGKPKSKFVSLYVWQKCAFMGLE